MEQQPCEYFLFMLRINTNAVSNDDIVFRLQCDKNDTHVEEVLIMR